jgi:hypothetical protein
MRPPKSDEDYEMDLEDKNEMSYTELILSIDDKISNEKMAFNEVKSCKNKDNASMAWENSLYMQTSKKRRKYH